MERGVVQASGRCVALLPQGWLAQDGTWRIVARGFADLGYEEFIELSDGRLLSVCTATESLPKERDFLFPVLAVDDAVRFTRRLGGDITRCEFVEQRTWNVEAMLANGEVVRGDGGSLHLALLHLLEAALVVTGKEEGR